MDNSSYKQQRLFAEEDVQISSESYNKILGGTLIWGILINIIMATVFGEVILEMNMLAVMIVYMVGSFICTYIVYNSSKPLVSFLAFTGLSVCMGLLLTFYVSFFEIGTVSIAFLSTGIVVGIMISFTMLYPDFFRGLGRTLFASLLISVIVEFIMSLLFDVDSTVFDYIIVVIFCGYIGYDWVKAQDYSPTVDNAIDSAADIYIDIVNLFIRILRILAKKND